MFKIISPRLNFFPRCVSNDYIKRFFLSNAYKCEEVWRDRLKNPIFEKTNPNSLYHELDICFQNKVRVNVVDVDILLNSVQGSNFKNEVDDVLLRIRLTPECRLLPERATHAAIRWYINNASKEDLLNILSDRLNYGLFPDYYLNNILMDKFLKENDATTAVKIAVLQMLQEDFDHPIMKALAVHCCYNYLESAEIWENYKEPEPDPDEEVKKVRVRFLKNPYFDDHFDITNTNHLVGKTLWLFGSTIDDVLGTSSQLVGLVLYEKYDKCADFLKKVIKDKKKIHGDAVVKAREYALKKPKQPEAEKSEGDAAGDEKKATKVENETVDKSKDMVLELLEKIDQKKLQKESLLSVSAKLVKKAVKDNEQTDIKQQCEVYKQWEKDRESNIQYEIERAQLENIKSEIKNTKEELEKEEERLFFFDKEEDYLMEAEIKEKEKASVVYYKGKRKLKEQTLDEYIPPDISRK